MEITIYRVMDADGNSCCVVAKEYCDTVHVWGLHARGEHQSFESDAKHLEAWAKEFGFTLDVFTMTIDLDRRKIAAWNETLGCAT